MQCDNFVPNNVQYVDKYKYLGHKIVNNLEVDEGINKQLRKLNTI